jgi:hypothetical protein
MRNAYQQMLLRGMYADEPAGGYADGGYVPGW